MHGPMYHRLIDPSVIFLQLVAYGFHSCTGLMFENKYSMLGDGTASLFIYINAGAICGIELSVYCG
ncbi:hypothetical protein BX666DRAFT_1991896 [Dichotomocladium elegans]|nr:hypothetical protein BX666DRAFT_1991896 [Dichotomocladium elegans]